MKTVSLFIALSLLFALPAMAQPVYKCPQPDGAIKYQKARCPEGGRIQIKDNGTVTGPANAVPVPVTAAAPAKPAAPPVIVQQPRSVMDSQAWKGLDKIQAESTATINALNRLRR